MRKAEILHILFRRSSKTLGSNPSSRTMDFRQNTGKSIQKAFDIFDQMNPGVYREFRNQALLAISKGKRKISFKMILNYIRWEKFMTTEEPTLFNQDGKKIKFKINDAYSSRYARKFITEFPEHTDKIEFRQLRS